MMNNFERSWFSEEISVPVHRNTKNKISTDLKKVRILRIVSANPKKSIHRAFGFRQKTLRFRNLEVLKNHRFQKINLEKNSVPFFVIPILLTDP